MTTSIPVATGAGNEAASPRSNRVPARRQRRRQQRHERNRRTRFSARELRLHERRQIVHRREICLWIQGEDDPRYDRSSCLCVQPLVPKLLESCIPPQLVRSVPDSIWNDLVKELNGVVPYLFREGILLQLALYSCFLMWIVCGILVLTDVIFVEIFMIGTVFIFIFVVAWVVCVAQLERMRDAQIRCILEEYNQNHLVELGWGAFLRSHVSVLSFFCQTGSSTQTNGPPKRVIVFHRVVSVEEFRRLMGSDETDSEDETEDETDNNNNNNNNDDESEDAVDTGTDLDVENGQAIAAVAFEDECIEGDDSAGGTDNVHANVLDCAELEPKSDPDIPIPPKDNQV